MTIIRNATLDDIDEITDLLAELGYPASCEEVNVRLAYLFQHPDFMTLLAVGANGVAMGMIGMSKNQYYEYNGQYIRVLVMVVGTAFRSKGIGKKLMAEAEKWAQAIGANAVLLNSGSRPERQGAYVFYQKLGYEIKSAGFVKKIAG